MQFGRVEGIVTAVEGAAGLMLRLTVYLEIGERFEVVRDETLPPLRPIAGDDDLTWHADQLTQETIGVDLANRGWEAIAAGEIPPPEPGALARSAAYTVRRLG
jgi:hypothetical protein